MLEEVKATVCIPLSDGGGVVKMDYQDFKRLPTHKKIYKSANRYGAIWHNKKEIYIHRFVMNSPKGKKIDHINGDSLDNRKSNLRSCEHWENLCNAKMRTDNSSGYRGVERHSQSKHLYFARITANKKKIYLGIFKTPEDAARAYNEAALIHHGKFARLNKITGEE